MRETVLRAAVASFCPSSCIACVRECAAGMVEVIALRNAPEQDKLELFTCGYDEGPF